jgi:glycosyltransferase involved in cell wall biosynthesis
MYNILFLVISPPFSKEKNSVTGPERRAARLSSRWRVEGFNVTVCYPKRGRLIGDFTDVKLIDFEIGSKFNLFAIFKLIRIIKSNDIDLVHSQGPASLDLFLAIASVFVKVKTIVTRPVMLQDQFHYSYVKIKIYEFIDKYLTLKIINKVICVSEDGYVTMNNRYRVEKRKLDLIYNGVDAKKIFPVKRKECELFKIGMIGQLFPPKGWRDFILTIHYISTKSQMPFQALIVGEGEQRDELNAFVESLGLGNIIVFKGYVDNIRNVLKELDLILFTTHREGFSVAILEAMAAGLPQVITDVGGGKEQIIHGENGYVVQCGDIEKMGDYCLSLMNDYGLRKRFGSAARVLVKKKFSEEAMFKSHVKLYNDTLLI